MAYHLVQFGIRNKTSLSRRFCRNPIRTQHQQSGVLRMPRKRPRPLPEIYELDGRKAHQWVTSIVTYLDWRAGREWRPASHRWLPESYVYTQARQIVYRAFHEPVPARRRAA